MKVRKRALVAILINIMWILVYIAEMAFLQEANISKATYSFISLLTVLSMLSLLFANCKVGLRIVSPYNIILILTYMYTCGQLWLVSLNIPLKKTSYLITYYEDYYIIISVIYTMLFVCVINLCAQFFTALKYEKWIVSREYIEDKNKTAAWEYTGIIFFIVFASVMMIFDIQQISIARVTNSYAATYSVGRSNPLYYMASYAYPLPIFMILCATKNKTLKKVIALYAVIRPLLMTLMVGSRAFYLPMLVAMFVYYLNTATKQIKMSRILLIGLAGILLYSFVAATRNVAGGNVVEYMIDNNFFVDFLQEMGGTIVCTILLVLNCPNPLGFAYGKSYLGSLLMLIPGLGSLADKYSSYINIATILNNYFAKGSGLGGFYLSEFYYNFSLFGLLLMPLVAYFFVKVSASCESVNSNTNPISASVAYYIFSLSMIYIRAEAYELFYGIKVLCLVLIVFYALYQILRRKSA